LRAGIFGGTFDPIHTGHLIVAEEARIRLELDQVLFMPAGRPWLKADQVITEARHRMAMVELAVESNPHFSASDVEIKRPGPTYTVDTLEEMRGRLGPDADIFAIMGLDLLKELGQWHEPHRLFEPATVVGMSRPGSPQFDPAVVDAIVPGASARVVLLNGPMVEISGAELRRRVAEGLSIRYQVPEAVEAYIREHRLYKGYELSPSYTEPKYTP
jgi:nicotinate-nucleotide adenylyltransferase